MGCLYSRNAPLNNALGNLGYFAACSGHTQWAVANMLGDAQWLAVYLEENNRRKVAGLVILLYVYRGTRFQSLRRCLCRLSNALQLHENNRSKVGQASCLMLHCPFSMRSSGVAWYVAPSSCLAAWLMLLLNGLKLLTAVDSIKCSPSHQIPQRLL